MEKIPISAVVVTYNEELYLEECLKSISFCEEVVVIDLGSTDYSIEIAKKYATKVIKHERVPVVEIIHAKIKEFATYDWVLITDPDELTDKVLAEQIIELFEKNLKTNTKIGALSVPWVFYFGKKRLRGTVWGGINRRIYIVNINRFIFSDKVHTGRRLAEGFEQLNIEHTGENIVHHYWMDNYKQLIKKHKRYIKQEGRARYENGKRTNLKKIVKIPFKEFKFCFYTKKGYKDGLRGLFLSFFWVWYNIKSEISLFRYQKKMKK